MEVDNGKLLIELLQRTASLESKLDAWMESRDREIKELKGSICKHEERLSSLESSRNKLIGICVSYSVAAYLLLYLVKFVMAGKFQ